MTADPKPDPANAAPHAAPDAAPQAAPKPGQRKPSQLQDVWPLSPLQQGLFFHARYADASADVYTAQAVVELRGALD
ncbi:hypothetical protein AB0J52_40960, partial [Spirillospora sp. NPDC049652]